MAYPVHVLFQVENKPGVRIYFEHFDSLILILQKLLKVQRFCSRRYQYEPFLSSQGRSSYHYSPVDEINELPASVLGKSELVQHRASKQKFELTTMKLLDLKDPAKSNTFYTRVKSLQKLADNRKLTSLVDCFEEDFKIHCVLQVIGEQTLDKVMA